MRSDAALNRDHLLEVGRQMASEGTGLTLNLLARRAAVGVATVYRHFPDVTALRAALMEAPLQKLAQVLERALAEPDPGDGLRALFLDVVALEMAHPMVVELVHSPHPVALRQMEKLQTAARALVRRARRAKALRPGVTAKDVCQLLLGVSTAARDDSMPGAAAHRYALIVLDGLLRRRQNASQRYA